MYRQFPFALQLRPRAKSAITFLLFVGVFNLPHANAQTQTIRLKRNNITYDQIFREIKRQTGFDVLLISNKIQSNLKTDVNFSNTPLKEALDILLTPHHLEFV
ncbi:MAG TPA: hypothetical protein VK518_20960, partial [Puia sp.]|nr:hypothetical protein [Puia sp.]